MPRNDRLEYVQHGSVPGRFKAIVGRTGKPVLTSMTVCRSIPLQHGDVVVDLGAYVGQYALAAARLPVKKVIAYEPTPDTYRILAESAQPNLEVVNAAVVADERESVDFYISAGIGVSNSVVLKRGKERRVTVPAVSYEEAVRGATVVKIDVEGAEYTYPIVQPSLRAIMIDFHPIRGRRWVERAQEIMSEIEAAGFTPVVVPKFKSGFDSDTAASFVRDLPVEGGFEPMMSGEMCCGCGAEIRGDGRSLCSSCWELWSKKHREGFTLASEK